MNFRNLKYRIEYYDLKYPYLKYLVIALIFFMIFFRNINTSKIFNLVIQLTVLMISVIIHEVSHGIVAYFYGDDTAKRSGRLSLDPRVHISLEGLLLPLFLLLVGSPIIFGSAKPVPVNYNNLKPRKKGVIAVSLAGVISNFLLAFVGVIIIKFFSNNGYLFLFAYQLVIINIVLGTFNLLPIPPLDGSRVLRIFANYDTRKILDWIEFNPFFSFFLLILVLRSSFFYIIVTKIVYFYLGLL